MLTVVSMLPWAALTLPIVITLIYFVALRPRTESVVDVIEYPAEGSTSAMVSFEQSGFDKFDVEAEDESFDSQAVVFRSVRRKPANRKCERSMAVREFRRCRVIRYANSLRPRKIA